MFSLRYSNRMPSGADIESMTLPPFSPPCSRCGSASAGARAYSPFFAQDRPPRAVRLDVNEMLLPIQHQRHSQGDMPVPPAVSATLSIAQQHVQPPSRQVVTEQAVLEVDLEF